MVGVYSFWGIHRAIHLSFDHTDKFVTYINKTVHSWVALRIGTAAYSWFTACMFTPPRAHALVIHRREAATHTHRAVTMTLSKTMYGKNHKRFPKD